MIGATLRDQPEILDRTANFFWAPQTVDLQSDRPILGLRLLTDPHLSYFVISSPHYTP